MSTNTPSENCPIVPVSVEAALLARLSDLSVHTRTPVEDMLPLIFAQLPKEEFEQAMQDAAGDTAQPSS